MTVRDKLIEQLREYLEDLVNEVHFPNGMLRFTVDGGWLVKIDGVMRFRTCRPARKQARRWERAIKIDEAELDTIHEHIVGEFEQRITELIGQYGTLEVEFAKSKVSSLLIKMSFCRTRRHALSR